MYLSIKQAAKLLRASRQSVHSWINAGKLSTTVIAGRRCIIEDELFKAIQESRK